MYVQCKILLNFVSTVIKLPFLKECKIAKFPSAVEKKSVISPASFSSVPVFNFWRCFYRALPDEKREGVRGEENNPSTCFFFSLSPLPAQFFGVDELSLVSRSEA